MGHDELVALMVRAGAAAKPMLGRVLKEEGDLIMRDSQEEAPFRLGGLKGSGRVQNPVFTAEEVTVTLSYGSSAIKYAMYLHRGMREDGTHVIQNFRNGKKKDYLSDPVNAHIPGLDARIAMKLQEILNG